MSMRIILEACVDAAIASIRFYDFSFPSNLEHLRRVEQKQKLSFIDKCEIFLPAQIEEETIKSIKKLWHYLSEYWVHAKGIVKKIDENFVKKVAKPMPPMWSLALPYTYDERDIDDIKEFTNKLNNLKKIVENLLKPFSKTKNLT